ncbi:MAG TPA: hypothetical protein VGN89_14380 [Phenylobacterium sp.]|nr:hypothetical protein [Phenylobacterium sp.]
MRHVKTAVLATLAALSLAGCDRKKTAPPVAPPPAGAATPALDAAQAGLLAAAEPFEALTEMAFTAKPLELDRSIATAVATAEHVRPALPSDAQRDLKTQLDAIAAARRVDDRAGVALASVEIYRLLVSHAAAGPVPMEVNLLDYAGFRYDADLKARPSRWDDMAEAAAFGQEKWDAIAARVTDPGLHDRMAKALSDMAAAAARKDAALAADAVKRELDLVDLLEVFFTRPPA